MALGILIKQVPLKSLFWVIQQCCGVQIRAFRVPVYDPLPFSQLFLLQGSAPDLAWTPAFPLAKGGDPLAPAPLEAGPHCVTLAAVGGGSPGAQQRGGPRRSPLSFRDSGSPGRPCFPTPAILTNPGRPGRSFVFSATVLRLPSFLPKCSPVHLEGVWYLSSV